MRRLRRLLFAIVSTSLTFGIVLALVCVIALGTETGQGLLRQQTEAVVARILGSNFRAVLGEQTIDLTEEGNLAIGWSDVTLTRRDANSPASHAESIKVGIAVMPLLQGRLEFDRIEVSGATIDLTGGRLRSAATLPVVAIPVAEPQPSRSVPDRFARLLGSLETQLGALGRLGLDRVVLSDVELTTPIAADGGPFVTGIERAVFSLADPEALALSAQLRIDDAPIPVDATARFDRSTEMLSDLAVVMGPVPLGRLIPPGLPDDPLDRRDFATDAPLSMRFDVRPQGNGAGRRASLAIELGAGAVQAGKGHTRLERARIGFGYVEGEEAIELQGTELAFEDLSFGLDGRAVAVYDGQDMGAFNGFEFALQTRDMRSSIGTSGGSPLEASVVIEGRHDVAAKQVEATKLVLATGKGSLGGTAALRYGAPDAMTTLRLVASDLGAANVKAFWPFNIAVNTRRWVTGHVGDVGSVAGGVIELDLRRDRLGDAFKPGQSPRPDELAISLSLGGAEIATSGALPRLLDAGGEIATRGGDTRIDLDGARVEGFDTVAVEPSSILFERAPEAALHDILGTLALKLNGEMPELLAIAEREPINALRSLDVKPTDATGRATVDAKLTFLLGDDIPKNRQFAGWQVIADLDDAGLSVPVEGRRLAALKGPVTIVPGAASGEIEGTVDGIPATIAFRRPFGAAPEGERSLKVDLSLTGADAVALAPALSGIVDGPINASIVQGTDPGLTAEVDLSQTALTLPWIGWRKGKGVDAALAFDIVTSENGTELANLSLKGDGFSAKGEVSTDAEGIRSASLGEVALNPGDDIEVSVQRVSNGFSIRVDGESFDARPFLEDLKQSLGEKAGGSGPRSTRQIDVGIAVDSLTGFGGRRIEQFRLNYAGSGGEIAALSISGASRGGPFTADVSPRGAQRSIQIRTPDAGSLADFAGIYARMEGGAVSLDLLGSSAEGYRGTLQAQNFTLVDEPRLSNLVGSSPTPDSGSLSQALGTELRTERAFFDQASVAIGYGKGGLAVSEGIIRGPVFGSSFAGTVYDSRNRIDITGSFMPAYGVNRIFGAIPIVGQILGNGNEGGLIGITYKLDGAFSSPTLTVNPISAIAPGIFRSIFAYE